MRYLVKLMCVSALGVISLVGCQETSGDGGSGGSGGTGGIPACEVAHDCDDENQCTENVWVDDSCENTPVEDGSACDDDNECTVSACASGVCESTPVQDDTPCTDQPYANAEGTCTEGRCTVSCNSAEDCMDVNECAVGACSNGTCDSTPVQNGTPCFLGPGLEGNCFEGQCTFPCGDDGDCSDDNDCTADTCLQVDGGSKCDRNAVTDGTTCAGGTCQLGACQVTSSEIPCTEQGMLNAISAGCGPYTFDCDGPTELGIPLFLSNDVILDGGGDLIVEAALVSEGVSAELIGFVIAANEGIRNFAGDLRVIDSTITNESDPVEFGEIAILRGTLTLTRCTVVGSGEMEILSDDGGVSIANSTLSFGSEGGGITHISAHGALTITNSTLRSKGVFPVIALAITEDAPLAMIEATIVDGQCANVDESVVDIVSNGYNIESPGDTCGFDQTGDQSGLTAEELNLGPLADNGRPTPTHKPGDGDLGTGSVAIDAIPRDACNVDSDQRGQPRPEAGGTMCDVGSVEVQP
jgi:hypothetical protein